MLNAVDKKRILALLQDKHVAEASELSIRYCEACADDPEGWFLQGVIHAQTGDLENSERCFRCAVDTGPQIADAHCNLGGLLMRRGKLDEAEASLVKALELNPELVKAHSDLGNILFRKQCIDEAINCYRRAIGNAPTLHAVRLNLAQALIRKGDFELAITELQVVLDFEPDYAKANKLMGNCLVALGRLPEAVKYFRYAIQVGAEPVGTHMKLGKILQTQGMLKEAKEAFDAVIGFQSDHVEARVCRALILMLWGDYLQGWQEYEWRWKLPARELRQLDRPLWDGSSLSGRTILLHPEQGLGDSIQFIRFAPALKQLGATVLFMPPPPLYELMRGCRGLDRVLRSSDELPEYDVHLPLMSLPQMLGTEVETIPADIPYIHVDTPLKAELRALLDARRDKFRVGIIWAGGETAKNDHLRSCPVARFMALRDVPDVALFSLQKGERSAQLAPADPEGVVTDLAPLLEDFADTAAVMNELDLVISVDTATAHLAGALGRPVWTVIPTVPDWRWLLDRNDSPWYPGMTLFRQETPGDWETLFGRVYGQLTVLATSGPLS